MTVRIKNVIPIHELTLGEISSAKREAIRTGISRAIDRRLAPVEERLIVRQAQNIADFGTALDQWNTAALAVVGTAYSVFQAIAAPVLANNKVAVFYRVGIQTAPNPVSLLSFRQGVVGGTTYAQLDLQQLNMGLATEGYFSEPIVYEPNEVLNITVTASIATAAAAQVILGCFIIEPMGPTISG